MEDKKMLYQSISYLIGTVIVAIGTFCLSVFYSKMFAPSEFGVYSLVFSTYSLINTALAGWIISSIIRFYKEYEIEDLALFKATLFKSFVALSSIVFIIVLICFLAMGTASLIGQLSIIFSICFFFGNLVNFVNSFFRARQESKKYNLFSIVNSVFKIILVLVLYYLFNLKNVVSIALSILFSEVLVFIIQIVYERSFLYLFSKEFDFKIIKKMAKYGIPLIIVSISNWVLNISDRYIIGFYFNGMNEVGVYSYSYNLSNSLINTLSQFLMLGAYPAIISEFKEKGEKKTSFLINKYIKTFLFIMIPSVVGLCLISQKMFKVFVDDNYYDGYSVFYLSAIGIALSSLSQYFNKPFELKKQTFFISIVFTICAIINVALNFGLIPFFGYKVAAITTVFSYFLYCLIIYILSRRLIKIQFDYIYLAKLAFANIVMGISVFVLNLFVNDSVYSIILEVIVGVIVYLALSFLLKLIPFDIRKKEESLK